MYAAERHQRIMAQGRDVGRVEVNHLAELLGVTAETVRRDLTALERRGMLRRVHGGAIPIERLELEPTLATRARRLTAEKRRIAARAVQEFPEDGTVLFDAGTTTQAIVELIPPDLEMTCVTNSLTAAAHLLTLPKVKLLLVGGRVRPITGAAVGTWTTAALAEIAVDVAFLGTNGITVDRGLTTPDQAEAAAKRAMVKAAKRVIAVADATKMGQQHLHRFADLSQIDLVITDNGLDNESAAAIEAEGPEVFRA